MSYEEQFWIDDVDNYTPINPERLNHMEAGIKDNSDAWDSISKRPYVWSGTDIAVFNGAATAVLWDNANFRKLFPDSGEFPCVALSNGDNGNGAWTTFGALQLGGAISAGGYIAVQASKAVMGNARLNYTVTSV